MRIILDSEETITLMSFIVHTKHDGVCNEGLLCRTREEQDATWGAMCAHPGCRRYLQRLTEKVRMSWQTAIYVNTERVRHL
jgi:hypothetical protein